MSPEIEKPDCKALGCPAILDCVSNARYWEKSKYNTGQEMAQTFYDKGAEIEEVCVDGPEKFTRPKNFLFGREVQVTICRSPALRRSFQGPRRKSIT